MQATIPLMRARWLPVYLFYLLLAMLITWPLVAQMESHLAGLDYGDSPERAHHVWWLSHALRTGQPLFWLPNLGWPDGMAGVTLLGHPLQHIPAALLALVLPLLVADNLALLLQMALMGLGMYALGLRLGGGSRGAALVGGLVFMAAPTFQAHFGEGHNVHHSLAFAPLFVLALLRLREARGSGRRRWFVAGVLCFMLINGGQALNAIYMLLPLTVLIVLQQLWRRDWPGLAQTLLVCVTGAALQLILILPIVGETLGNRAYSGAGGDVRYSLDLLAMLSPSIFHPLYGLLDYTHQVLGTNIGEGSAWIGLVAGALAVLALARGRGRFWLGLALLAWVLALGPILNLLGQPLSVTVDGHATFVTLPMLFVEQLPLLSFGRAPGRFGFAIALAIASLATLGAAQLLAHRRLRGQVRQALLVTLLLAAILFDYQWFWPFPTQDAAIPAEIAALGQRNDLHAVLNVPVRNRGPDKEALWLHTAHRLPLLGGHITRESPVNPARLELLARTLDPALLRVAGADIVIVHRRFADSQLLTLAETQLGSAIYADEAFAVYETPATEAAPLLYLPPDPSQRFTEPLDLPLYAPQDGWLDLSATMAADGRALELLLDAVSMQRWSPQEAQTQRASLPLRADSWHMLTLAPAPDCPRVPASALTCPLEALQNFTLEMIPATLQQARFAAGVTLRASSLPAELAAGDELVLRLHWEFNQGRDEFDVRFVHLLDAAGNLVAQSDATPGELAAGSQRSERIALTMPAALPAGDYSARLGWYRHPQGTRLSLLEPADAPDDVLSLGVVRID